MNQARAASSTSQTTGAKGPPFAKIRNLLDHQRQLGPAERGSEDEIRCALALLLTDDNAGIIVRSLSPAELHSEFGATALSRWATRDGVAASLWLAQQPVRSEEQTWAIARALAKEPVVLEVLCDLLPASPWREDLLENTSHASLPDHPDNAVRLAYRLQPGYRRTQALAGIADEWAMREPVAAARWIAAESDAALRDELLFSSAAARAATDPTDALDSANRITSNATYERAIDKIAAIWTDLATDPSNRIAVTAALRRDGSISRKQN